MNNKKVIKTLNFILLPLIVVVFLNGVVFPNHTANILSTFSGDINSNVTLSFYYIGKISFVLLLETGVLSGFFYFVSKRYFHESGDQSS